jgi:hypothetical protein
MSEGPKKEKLKKVTKQGDKSTKKPTEKVLSPEE